MAKRTITKAWLGGHIAMVFGLLIAVTGTGVRLILLQFAMAAPAALS